MARRKTNTFSLSFLDIMACGFGAVVLFFMIINHSTKERSDLVNSELLAEITKLEVEVLEGEDNRAVARNTLEEVEQERVETRGRSRRILETLNATEEELAQLEETTLAREEHLNKLKADLRSIDEESRRLEGSISKDDAADDQGDALRTFVGEGDRQYVTGLKVGGDRVLILVDASASMLDETIVNIIRRRNMSNEQKTASRKWQRALLTVDWIAAQLNPETKFQLYTFNLQPSPVLGGTGREWLPAGDGVRLNEAVEGLRRIVPENGTSLENVFRDVAQFSPLPDNIYLITDGLPTQGRSAPRRRTVSPDERLRHFERAVRQLPSGVPVNTILLPMEGDPRAASSFWQLAQLTNGSFLSPARDWP